MPLQPPQFIARLRLAPLRCPALRMAACALALACCVLPASAQTQPSPLSLPASQWASEASKNELKVLEYGHVYLRYRMHSRNDHGDQVRDIIQSKQGSVARLILKEGRPLTPEEDTAERTRLQALLDSPSSFAKHIKNEDSGKKVGADLIKLVPDAMLFTYTPGQPQRPSHEAHPDEPPEIVLDFKPNPQWSAPTITADALTGLEGRAWIDPRTHYVTRLEGTIFRPVNFGFFVAHIFPGGKLTFEQTPVTEQRWIFTHFTEHLLVRVVFKTVHEDSDLESSSFAVVKEMSYQDAIHTLLDTPLPKN